MFSSLAVLASSLLVVNAATVSYYWDLTWVWAAPDGFGRPVIGINGTWPPPEIHCNLGDTIMVRLTNSLGNQSTALHFHGENQGKSSQMEGAAGVSQCAQPPGMVNTFTFIAKNTGTHWYHAHIGGSYLDGFRGPLIVHDTTAPYYGHFDPGYEYVMTVSDWYHQQAANLVHTYQNQPKGLRKGVEPTPDSSLINDSTNVKFNMVPGKRYLFRIINMSGFASMIIKFGGHDMTIVETDGVATEFTPASQIQIATAQRYAVIIQARPNATENFAIMSAMMPSMFAGDVMPAKMNQTAYLVYDSSLALPPPLVLQDYSFKSEFEIPVFNRPAALKPTRYITANFDFQYMYGMSRGAMNGSTYIPPRVPTLYTALSAPLSIVTDPAIYGFTNTVVLNDTLGVLEVLVVNNDAGSHPFHIHGHTAQIVAQGPPGTPTKPSVWDGIYATAPAKRDVFMVYANSYSIIRFTTGNPGIWLLHCHIEWHIEAGLTMTFVEDPIQLQAQNLVIPPDMYASCVAQGIPTTGNAGGDTVDWYNMKNTPKQPDKNSWGANYP